MKKVSLFLIFLPFFFVVSSQGFNVPKNFKLEKAEDYAPLEKEVVDAINWLYETPINEQSQKRKDVNAFVFTWLSGSPYVHLKIKPEIVTFLDSSTPDFLIMFMGGWAKFSIESKEYDDKINGSLAGIEMVIAFYEKKQKLVAKRQRSGEIYKNEE